MLNKISDRHARRGSLKARGGLLAALAAGLLALGGPALAQMPDSISYQAYLTDNIGDPITSSSVTVTFRFFDAEAAVTPFYTYSTPTPLDLSLTGGFVNTSIPLSFNPNRLNNPVYLEVSVDDGSVVETLNPRQLLLPAAIARNADLLDGLDSSAFALARRANAFAEETTFKDSVTVARGVIDNPEDSNVSMMTVTGQTRTTGARSVIGLDAKVRASEAGARLPDEPSGVRAVLSEGASDGLYVTGLSATGMYFGDNESMELNVLPSVLGVNAFARFDQEQPPLDSARMNAIGVSARASDPQEGPNTGIIGAARNSSLINIGVSGVTGATESDALKHQLTLPEGFSASLYGFSRPDDPNGYGLYTVGKAKVEAPGSDFGDGANAPQLRVSGVVSGSSAAFPADYEFDVEGDARVAGDLRLGEGTMHLGSTRDGSYLRTSGESPLLVSPGNGEVMVAGRMRQTGLPEQENDLATVAWVKSQIANAGVSAATPSAPAAAAAGPVDGPMEVSGPVKAGGDVRLEASDAEFTYGQMRRRVLALPASAFKPARPGYDYVSDGSKLIDASPEADDGGQRYTAPVFLPDGATITRVTLEASDSDAAGAISFSVLSAATGSAPPIGGSGSTDDSGIQTAAINVPADDPFRVVDNGAFGYTAVVEFSENAIEALEVYTFRIEYGVSKAD